MNLCRFSTVLLLTLFSGGLVSAQYDFSSLDKVLESKKLLFGQNACVMVFKENKIVYERNLGDYNKNTVEPIASCSKWLTAVLAMTFVEEGKLSLDDYVCKYLPEFSKDGKQFIKVRFCMSHTSGIESKPITIASLLARGKYNTLAEEVADFAGKPMVGEPGKVFAYGNIGLNTVGRILEVISGQDFETLFQERIARPLGMKNTTFYSGNAVNPSGGAKSTASDYMNFLEMILFKGEFRGQRILTPNSVEMMQKNQTAGVQKLYIPEAGEGFEYGLGEWVQTMDNNGVGIVVNSPGLFGTYPFIDKARNYAAIVFVKNLKVNDRKGTDKAIKEAIDLVLDNH
jgi:CubicO group peptidase (beta-lactamase class C family)